MAKNRLGLRRSELHRLRPGQAAIIGPASRPTLPSDKIAKAKKSHPDAIGTAEFEQRQMILIDPKTLEAFKVYLVTRTS